MACPTTPPAGWRRSSGSSAPSAGASPRSIRAAGRSRSRWTTTSSAPRSTGLDFDHRVLKPWANNPAFYVTVFTRRAISRRAKGPFACRRRGAVDLHVPAVAGAMPRRSTPEFAADSGAAGAGEDQPDRQPEGHLDLRREERPGSRAPTCAQLAGKLGGAPAGLKADVDEGEGRDRRVRGLARFAAPSKTGPSGIGVDNYNWYLKNVQLVPVHVAGRGRAHGARARPLAVPSSRSRSSKQRQAAAAAGPIASAEEHDAALQRGGDRVHGVPARTTTS